MHSPGQDPEPPIPSRTNPRAPVNNSQAIDPNDGDVQFDSPAFLRRSEQKPLMPWNTRSNFRAWIGSTLLHTAVIVLVAMLWQPTSKGTNGAKDRSIGIAVARHTASGVEYELSGGGSNTSATANQIAEALSSQSTTTSSTESVDAAMQELLGPLASALNGVEVSGETAGGIGTPGISGEGSGGDARGNAGRTKTSFLGIEGEGSTFVYVVDYSESMAAFSGAPMARAKSELVNSIQSLTRVNMFQIVFYNDQPSKYGGAVSRSSGLIFANDIEKEAAINHVRNIEPFGGTEHYRALLMALAMRPDVIFFLTDAADPNLSQRQLDQVVARSESGLTTIHAIQFGNGENQGDGRWIEQLAARTQGKFRYIDASKLSARP